MQRACIDKHFEKRKRAIDTLIVVGSGRENFFHLLSPGLVYRQGWQSTEKVHEPPVATWARKKKNLRAQPHIYEPNIMHEIGIVISIPHLDLPLYNFSVKFVGGFSKFLDRTHSKQAMINTYKKLKKRLKRYIFMQKKQGFWVRLIGRWLQNSVSHLSECIMILLWASGWVPNPISVFEAR